MHDLSWTGNHLIDRGLMESLASDAVRTVELSSRGDTFASGLAGAWARAYGVPSAHVIAGAGSTPILDRVVSMLGRDRLVIDVVPNYLQIAITCRRERIEYVAVPVREGARLLPALRPFLGRREIVLCLSSPRNPFGYRFEDSALRELLTARPAPYVVLDEVYGDLDPVPTAELAGEFPNLLLVRSLSKAWALANVRVGFLIWSRAPEGFAASHMLRNHLGGLQQAIGLAVLERGDAIRRSFREIRALRDWFSAEVSAAGYRVWPSEAGFVCLETKESEALGRRLEEGGIRVAQLHALPGYAQDWPAGLRVAMAPKPVLQKVFEVLARANAAI